MSAIIDLPNWAYIDRIHRCACACIEAGRAAEEAAEAYGMAVGVASRDNIHTTPLEVVHDHTTASMAANTRYAGAQQAVRDARRAYFDAVGAGEE